MNENIFRGDLVRLGAEDPEVLARAFVRWGSDTEYVRLLDDEPARPWSEKKFKEWFEKDLENEDYFFAIRTLQDDRLIGFVGLGEREYWGQGYGTEAMRLLLRYAFTELNLRRVSLGVFDYNPRAFRSYEKAGFTYEGRQRKQIHRDGRRSDLIHMGVLREEWEEGVTSDA